MQEEIKILLFYKYIRIDNPIKFREKHLAFCKNLGIRGRIIAAKEGINGSVSGTEEQTEEYKKNLREDERFSDIVFKEDYGLMHPFNKMVIKIKKEIVNFGVDVDLSKTGKHLTPKEFLELYENKEEVIILDARNNYESRVGKFKNAVDLNIGKFRDFPKAVENLKDKKDKKIVMYCTGGIRCEKASAYLVEQGFGKVYQLNGGILTFGKEFPDTIWEGKCFVFDKRLASSINSNKDDCISNCEICDVKCDLYRNCRNNECDKLSVVCLECEKSFGGCCSEDCFNGYV